MSHRTVANEEEEKEGTPRLWERVLLGFVCVGGLTVLLVRRPELPVAPWAAVQPTSENLIRTWGLLVVWLMLGTACLIAGWFAWQVPRGGGSPEPNEVIDPRRHVARRRLTWTTSDQDLLALFASPRGWPREIAFEGDEVERDEVKQTTMTPLLLRRFGPLGVVGNDDQRTFGERATRGLIVFLALKGGPASLDELSEALWPGESPSKARPRLWKAKRQAQRVLGEALMRRGDAYELDRKLVRFDGDELIGRAAADLGEMKLEEAFGVVEGAPLADVDYPWADGERRRLQAIQSDLFARGAAAHLDVGDGRGALALAERLIESDSLNEQGWRIAMEAEALLGQRQAVLDRFERLRSDLDERVGLRPQASTLETYHRLLGQT